MSYILGVDVISLEAAPANFVPEYSLEVAPPPPPSSPPPTNSSFPWLVCGLVAAGLLTVAVGAALLYARRMRSARRGRNSRLLLEHTSEQARIYTGHQHAARFISATRQHSSYLSHHDSVRTLTTIRQAYMYSQHQAHPILSCHSMHPTYGQELMGKHQGLMEDESFCGGQPDSPTSPPVESRNRPSCTGRQSRGASSR